jgi:hypothetical protein
VAKGELYSDDVLGRLFAKNGRLVRMLVEADQFLARVPVKTLTLEEAKKLANLRNSIKQFNKEQR